MEEILKKSATEQSTATTERWVRFGTILIIISKRLHYLFSK